MSDSFSRIAESVGTALAFADAAWTQAGQEGSRSVLQMVKEQLGLDDTVLACLGWPIRSLLEVDKPKDDAPKKASYTFTMDKVENDARNELLKALQEKKFSVIWELLKGQVICIPDLAEDDHVSLETVLKKYKLKTSPVKETVEPLLVGLFLLEFYNYTEYGRESQVIDEDGGIRTSSELMEEVQLLESSTSYKSWLALMFPDCAMEYVTFLAGQAPKA